MIQSIPANHPITNVLSPNSIVLMFEIQEETSAQIADIFIKTSLIENK